MGLVILGVLVLYLLISVGIVMWAASYARKNKKNAKMWGGGAALVMYLLVFWDHIPTVVAHKYYCEAEAGFWIYKTVDEWKAENPGAMETLMANQTPVSIQNAYVLNERFNWVIKQKPFFPLNHMIREEQQIVDSRTKEILGRYVNYSASHERRQAGWTGWKFWLDSSHCDGGVRDESKLRQFKNKFRGAAK